MATKTNPGEFPCYAAALPDEPIFTILGRDPAGPATLRFWASERARQGKTINADDFDRHSAALVDAVAFEQWRERNLDPVGDGTPSWKLPRPDNLDDGPAICIQPGEHTIGLREALMNLQMLENRGDSLRSPGAQKTHSRKLHLIRQMIELLDGQADFAGTVQPVSAFETTMDRQEAEDRGGCDCSAGMSGDSNHSPGCPMHRPRVRSIETEPGRPSSPGAPPSTKPSVTVSEDFYNTKPYVALPKAFPDNETRRVGKHPSLGAPYTPVIDSAPEDLAHAPEVPPHRFSQFHKGEHYAYARGLEINPTHLPVALDAMQKDGWALMAIFGQTDSQHVGFVFRRLPSAEMTVEAAVPPEWMKDLRQGYVKPEMVSRATNTEGLEVEIHVGGGTSAERMEVARLLERQVAAYDGHHRVQFIAMVEGVAQVQFEFGHWQDRGNGMHHLDTKTTLWPCESEAPDCSDYGNSLAI